MFLKHLVLLTRVGNYLPYFYLYLYIYINNCPFIVLCQHFSGIFDHEHRSPGPRNSFDDGDDESTFLKKGVKNEIKLI